MTEEELTAGLEMVKTVIREIKKLDSDSLLTDYQKSQLVLMGGLTTNTLDIARQLTVGNEHLKRIADAMDDIGDVADMQKKVALYTPSKGCD